MSEHDRDTPVLGSGSHRYRPVPGWGTGPDGREPGGMVTGVAVGAGDADRDRLYAFQRDPVGEVLVYERDGRFVDSWGAGVFAEAHNVSVSGDGRVLCTDRNDHTVRVFSRDGRLLRTLGTVNRAGAPGEPFDKPCQAVVDPDTGAIWVADGYGNARIHRFSTDGAPELSFGAAGSDGGQFDLPHSLALDRRGRLVVVDRENHRLQLFGRDGRLLAVWGAGDLRQPMDVHVDGEGTVYVAECHQRITIYDPHGAVISRWGERGEPPGRFPSFLHGICTDSHGDLYVADEQRLQKFERVP